MLHKYPVLIISKDRATTCSTHLNLDQEGINWYYCVEPQDYDNYVDRLGEENVINIQQNDQGIAYTRNYCIKWSLDQGYAKHWQFEAKENPLKIIISFENEEDREESAEKHKLEFVKKQERTWMSRYPFIDRIDLVSVKFE